MIVSFLKKMNNTLSSSLKCRLRYPNSDSCLRLLVLQSKQGQDLAKQKQGVRKMKWIPTGLYGFAR